MAQKFSEKKYPINIILHFVFRGFLKNVDFGKTDGIIVIIASLDRKYATKIKIILSGILFMESDIFVTISVLSGQFRNPNWLTFLDFLCMFLNSFLTRCSQLNDSFFVLLVDPISFNVLVSIFEFKREIWKFLCFFCPKLLHQLPF